MRRTKEEAERTRKQLLDAGLTVFGDKGYAAARLSDIAEEAGVTRGAVYWHFGSKKGLMFAVLKEMSNPYIRIAAEVLESDLPAEERIREMIRRVIYTMDRDKNFISHEQIAVRFMAEHPAEFEEYHGDFSVGMKRVTNLLKRAIREGQRAGQIRRDVNAKIIAGTVGAVLRGSAMMKKAQHMNLLIRGASKEIAELLMRGLEPR
jgi:AcrR family transcriptional regulator